MRIESSSSKGKKFEDLVFDRFNKMIEEGEFLFASETCQVFKRKSYYSEARKSEITFDVSIEVSRPGVERRSVLMLIECKDLSRSVSVNDVEEFSKKLEQVGAHKGVFATRTHLQRSAFNFAESEGIGIVRFLPNDNIQWELERSPSSIWPLQVRLPLGKAEAAVTEPDYRAAYFDSCCYFNELSSYSINEFLLHYYIVSDASVELADMADFFAKRQNTRSLVRMIPQAEIEDLAKDCLELISYSEGHVDLEEICRVESRSSGLELYEIGEESDEAILGAISFKPLRIGVRKLENRGRQRFTLAHELGHYFLRHQEYLRKEITTVENFQRGFVAGLQEKDVQRLEKQANYFASCLLLPKEAFLKEFVSVANRLGVENRGFGPLFVDEQRVNQQTYFRVTDELKMKFRASRQAIERRLLGFRLLNDQRSHSVKRVGRFGAV